MSSRHFRLSLVASTILCFCSAEAVAASVTEAIDSATKIDLINPVTQDFHLRQSDAVLARAGVGIIPAVNGSQISHRSATDGVAVLQDGIFFSPAPYSGQHLNLQPNLFHQSEVSSSSISSVTAGGEGAFGQVDYKTVQISQKKVDSYVNIEVDDNSALNGGIVVSGTSKDYGMLLAVDYQAVEQDMGFKKGWDGDKTQTDLMFKINAGSLPGSSSKQKTEFSFQYSDIESDDASLGLTTTDFASLPQGHYSASQNDYSKSKRHRYALAHQVILSPISTMTTDFYYQSYKQKIDQMSLLNGASINNAALANIALFEAMPVATGLNLGSIVQNNDFDGFGVQTKGVTQYGNHLVTYTGRYHSDKAEMRLGDQNWLLNQDLGLTTDNIYKDQLNYVDHASALTSAVDANLNYGQWSVNLGFGYEHVNVEREIADNTLNLGVADFSDDGFIPSIEVAYKHNAWVFALQAKQAWTAASAGNLTQESQDALMYQLAASYKQDNLSVAVKTYIQNFDNQHLSCSWALSCDYAQMAVQENIKDVDVSGVDFSVNYDVQFDKFAIPLSMNYQYAQAELATSGCNSLIGCYQANQQVPWMPEQQLTLSAGVMVDKLSFLTQALYQSELGYMSNSSQMKTIDAQWKVDFVVNYQITPEHEVYLRVDNILDETLVAAHSQRGLFAQSEMTTYFGYQGHF